MLERVLQFAIERRWLIVLFVVALAGFGVYSLQRLPIDAVPDITNNQVQINTVFAGFSPVEIEQQITFPIETALAGIPGLLSTRVALPQWLFSGDGRLPGRCQHLLCPATGQ